MPQNLYIASAEPGSGKSVVVLGIMALLSGYARKVGFFRPLIAAGTERDPVIDLIASRYNLNFPYETMYGCTGETARELAASGRYSELLKCILDKFKALEKQCDLVLCAGTDFTGIASAFEFDFNVDVANNLGCLFMPVVNGHNKVTADIVDAVRVLLESLAERGCDSLAAIVNRVATNQVDDVAEQLRRTAPHDVPLYVVPEHAMLGKPTVGEIARALDARCISGEAESFHREVAHYKVAAMELPNFLDHIEDGSLIITPGDRADIILGSLLSDVSTTYPQIAGLLLTGDLEPAPQVQRLIEGLNKWPVPVMSVTTDTYVTAMKVSNVEGSVVPDNERKIAEAQGIMEAGIDNSELEKRLAVTRPARVTPLMFEHALIQRAKASRKHIVLPEGTDDRILRASEILILRGIVDVTLLGNPHEVRQKISTLGLALDEVNIVDPVESDVRKTYAQAYYELRRHKGISKEMAYDAMADVSYYGTMMVHHGDANGMVSGAAHTTQHTIRPAFEIIRTRPGCSIVSSVFLMCLEDRVLVYGDCAVNPNPNAEQLADIAISSAATAQMFGITPRIAMLSYSSGESGKGEAVDKVRNATHIARQLRPDLKIEGPIQYDAAVDASVAKSKMPDSDVAGQATVFIFPDLNTGNNTYKAVQRSADAVAIGPVLQGLNKPVNDLSRSCTVTDIVNTVAITAIQAQSDDGIS